MQAFARMHDTPRAVAEAAPAGLGIAWMPQLVPSQCSATVMRSPLPLTKEPTAVQAFGELHDSSKVLIRERGPGSAEA